MPRDESINALFKRKRGIEKGTNEGKTVVGQRITVRGQTKSSVTKNGKTKNFK